MLMLFIDQMLYLFADPFKELVLDDTEFSQDLVLMDREQFMRFDQRAFRQNADLKIVVVENDRIFIAP
jgi:hypothetical protein